MQNDADPLELNDLAAEATRDSLPALQAPEENPNHPRRRRTETPDKNFAKTTNGLKPKMLNKNLPK
jgi:hypothetical protein